MTDIYTRAVAMTLDIPDDQVTKEQRAAAKTLCFASIYRASIKPRTQEDLLDELLDVLCVGRNLLRNLPKKDAST